METKNRIYPGREKNFEKELKRLEEANISQRNKELITMFQNHLFSKGTSGSIRISKLCSQLRRICTKLDKPLNELDKGDITNLIALYNKDPSISEATKADYRRVLKQFFLRWYKAEDPRVDSDNVEERSIARRLYSYLEDEVTSSYRLKQADPETIITEEDCKVIVEYGCRTPREKAFLSVLHETGARAGEFLNIKLGDIEVKESHVIIQLDGKTGRRSVFITKSVPHLLRYLEVHPFKDNRQSYIWLSEAQRNRGEPMLHRGAQKLIDRCIRRARISKKHNLHWFRHSRATLLAPKMTTPMLCKYMGWSLNSRQIKTYCHLSAKQLEDVYLSINGIKPKKETMEKPIECVCGTLNNPNERYCFKCYRPLKVETLIQDEAMIQDKPILKSETDKTIRFLMQIANNPELMKKFNEFKESLNKT